MDFRQGGNVHWTPAFEWPEYEAWIDEVMAKVGPNDWMIIDFISTAWEAVQTYYVSEIFKQESGEFFLEARKNMKGGNALDGWKDWQYINKLYKTWVNKVLHRTGGHKFLTAQADSLRENDDRAVRAMFGSYGVRPKGQKELGYQTHTILLTGIERGGNTNLTTIKDRERKRLDAQTVNEFTVDYLVNVGGWTL